MRRLLCMNCTKDKLPEGVREICPASEIGEPAEIQRLVVGIARTPRPEQRYMEINGKRIPLSMDSFTCDDCSAEIKPGERCSCWSVWTEQMQPVPAWENNYIEAIL